MRWVFCTKRSAHLVISTYSTDMTDPKKLKIGMYAGSWPQNIGNAFFDFGAEAIIRTAFPNAEVTRTGGAVHWMFNNSHFLRNGLPGKISRRIFPNWNPQSGNSLEIGEIAKFDLLVFAGMSLTKEFVTNNGATLLTANKRGVAILGLGVGASTFSEEEAEYFSFFFQKLKNSGLITRDSDTFKLFSNKIQNIEPGIDCAFFLPEYFTPPKVSIQDYFVATFDFRKVPDVYLEGTNYYFTHHQLWGRIPRKFRKKSRTLISDVPEDYLTLYANCKTTYSDRVHACVASLAYGNAAQLFSSTPRKALFTEIGLESIISMPVRIDKSRLSRLKKNQVLITEQMVKKILSRDE